MMACSQCVVVDSAARRICAEINLVITSMPWDQLIHAWQAFRLDDGTTDYTLYPSRGVALTYQLRPCGVFCYRNALGGVSVRDVAIWLAMQRAAFESDRVVWIDPASPDIIISTRAGDHLRGRVSGHG
jgi:hypothetical protein